MEGINIFGTGLSLHNTSQRGPPGIGFKYLDEDHNYDIDFKRLANVAEPVNENDAATKIYTENSLDNVVQDTMHYLDQRIKNDINKNIENFNSKLSNFENKISELENYFKIYVENNVNSLKDIINETERGLIAILDEKLINITRKITEIEKVLVTKDRLNYIMREKDRILEAYLNSLRTELSSDIAYAVDKSL